MAYGDDDGDDVSGGGTEYGKTDLERIRAYQVSTNNGSINTKKGHNTKRPPRANSKNILDAEGKKRILYLKIS